MRAWAFALHMGLAGVVTGSRAGRRYTLTEGDFHHLKNARLTHLHLPPLKIITIHECDLGEASATTPLHAATAPKANLAIFQVSPRVGQPGAQGTGQPPCSHPLSGLGPSL